MYITKPVIYFYVFEISIYGRLQHVRLWLMYWSGNLLQAYIFIDIVYRFFLFLFVIPLIRVDK